MMPEQIGRYKVLEEVGRGGMAVVYLARDLSMERDVAIKVLPAQLLEQDVFRKRFEREAKVIANFEHPSIVPVYDYGEENNQLYLVMRYMSGGSLADRIKQKPLSFEETSQIFLRLAPALDQVHARGIVHRDLKPGNILFDRYGNAYISDFGIARLIESSTNLTGDLLIGTPAYMSPEQVRGEKDIDARSDVYALGAILYEMLTGKQPYDSTTPIGLALKHITEPVPRILSVRADLPPESQHIISKAMAKDRQQRFRTAGDMAEAMQAIVSKRSPSPVTERSVELPSTDQPDRRKYILAGAALLVVVALSVCALVYGWMNWGSSQTAEKATEAVPVLLTDSSIAAIPTVLTTAQVIEPSPTAPAVQPQATSAPAVSIAPGPAVFRDDFSDPNSGWERFSNDAGSADYYRGHYRVYAELPEIIAWGVANRTYSDVTLEVEATKVSGTDNNYIGVICRYQDEDKYYLFAIQSSGYYAIEKHKAGKEELLGSEFLEYSDTIHQGNTTNHFQVSCIGDTLTFYLNGLKLQEVKDTDISSGDVGLAAAAFEVGNTEILFDNFGAKIP